MAICCKKLWTLLMDRDMTKKGLQQLAWSKHGAYHEAGQGQGYK